MNKTKKIIFSFFIIFMSIIKPAFAQIVPPLGLGDKFAKPEGFALLIATLWKTAFLIGGIVTLVYFVLGGLTWITAGGDKANSERARSMITDALIGLVILASSFALIKFLDSILGTNILNPQFPVTNFEQ